LPKGEKNMSADLKRKSPCANTGRDSWKNLEVIIPHPIDFSSEKGERAEILRLALAALSADEFVEWFSAIGSSSACGNQSGFILNQSGGFN
jgi:hypothetical protein